MNIWPIFLILFCLYICYNSLWVSGYDANLFLQGIHMSETKTESEFVK